MLLVLKLVAAIFKAMVVRLLVGSRRFPMIFSPLIRLSGHSRSQETKWSSVSHLLISDPASLNAVNLGQIRTGHAKQLRAQFKLWCISLLLFEPCLSPFFRQ